MKRVSSSCAVLTLALSGAAVTAIAQESGQPFSESNIGSGVVPKKRSVNRLLEEVVVTAQKREENISDVPISIQAFSGDQLSARGIEDPKALQLVTPGLTYNVVGGYSVIYLRGVGTDAFVPSADPSVATYIDGVYYAFGHGLAQALGAVDRIEILKGPQGTLFGRNSTGGAISIVTKQPGPELEAQAEVVAADYNKRNLRAFVNLPVTDRLAVSLSGLKYSEDNYYTLSSESSRDSLPKEESSAFSIGMGWSPLDNLQVGLSYKYISSEGAQAMMLPTSSVKPLGQLTQVVQQPDYQTGEDALTYIDSESEVISADIKFQTDYFDTRFIASDQQITSPAMVDIDGSSMPLVGFEAIGQYADVRTAELQFLSNDSSWGSDWLEWIGGLYYLESDIGYDPLLVSVAPQLLSFLTNPDNAVLGSVAPLVSAVTDLLNEVLPDDFILDLNNPLALHMEGILGTESTAAFFQTTADLSDNWSITFGGRYQEEERALLKSNVNVTIQPDGNTPGLPALSFQPRSSEFSNFSPKAVLIFKFSDDDMVYLSYSKGFKSGTYNIINIYTEPQFVEPEDTTAFELGYKGSLLDGALRLSGAIFQNDIKNVQVQTVSLASGGVVRLETAGRGRIRGADFDLTWQVAPEVLPGLVLTGGGAYLDSEYLEYKEGSGFDEDTGIFYDGTILPARDFSGNDIVRSPEYTATLGFNYSFDFPGGPLEVAADAYYNSGFYYTAQNRASSEEEGYTVVSARISYLYEDWNLRLTGYGKNITDELYTYNMLELDFGTARLLAPPVTYGIKVNWEY